MAQIGARPRRFSHIYVGDLVDGLIAATHHAGAGGRIFYLANAQPVSWEEFGNVAARLMGRKVRTVAIPEKAAHVLGLCAECLARFSGKPGILSRDKVLEARRELGFCASTDLEEGLRRTLDWYKEAGWLKF
jgi:nucleoside-diphosphate-sugar epimerase